MPRSRARRRSVRTPVEAMKVLDGTQSHSTHAPPTPSLSITVTAAPCWAATSAASYPAGPPPMIAMRVMDTSAVMLSDRDLRHRKSLTVPVCRGESRRTDCSGCVGGREDNPPSVMHLMGGMGASPRSHSILLPGADIRRLRIQYGSGADAQALSALPRVWNRLAG